jgi:hypothetical protein
VWSALPVDDESLRFSYEVCHDAHILHIRALVDVCLHALMTTICHNPEHWKDTDSVLAKGIEVLNEGNPVVRHLRNLSVRKGVLCEVFLVKQIREIDGEVVKALLRGLRRVDYSVR